ncbi:MAG: LysM peptidoglycan-binding domain-containing protein [Planctomycetes bacterium]|nr:LysM peptidoglycan-binding domain-containing protein [Planctomycetota bacterium]
MTATRKLLLAAVLLAAGFGVARLMGEPAARWYAPQLGATAQRPAIASKAVNGGAIGPRVSSGARLVPDFGANNPYQVRTDSAEPAMPAHSQALANHRPASLQAVTVNGDAPPAQMNYVPRAKLRDEAPRPLAIESRSPAVAYTPLPLAISSVESVGAPEARSASADWRTSGLTQARFTQDATNVATISASYSQPAELSNGVAALTVSPPPWPEPAEENGPRTHVVVDGDSLEKLAGRYLDDPRRGNEIYEANRELLASPDLLPIGAELVIPKASSRSAFEGSSPQSSIANDAAIRAAAHKGLVPVRPIPTSAGLMPRAQLMQPIPVE